MTMAGITILIFTLVVFYLANKAIEKEKESKIKRDRAIKSWNDMITKMHKLLDKL
jgi:hypothetical protein